MTKFNATKKRKKVINRAGGKFATSLSDKKKLATLAVASFLENQYYRNADESITELIELVQSVDPVFAAKVAIYARTKHNIRSTSHVIAAALANTPGLRSLYDKVVVRVDDMSEILAAYEGLCETSKRKNEKLRIPKGMKAGFQKAFDKFNDYQIAKYKMEGKNWSLLDIVNVVRPIPTVDNAVALKKLVNGEKLVAETWETKLTEAGQQEGNTEELKTAAWASLLRENKLGYMALLRNLRNIAKTDDKELLTLAINQLRDPKAIRNSKQLPWRFYTAYKTLKGEVPAEVLAALSVACDIAVENMPTEMSNSLIAVDLSGSMGSYMSGNSVIKCNEIASFFAAVIFKANMGDIIYFGSTANYRRDLNPADSVLTLTEKIASSQTYKNVGHGTSFSSVFQKADKKYDRVILFTDMQSWADKTNPGSLVNDAYIYSVDLQGYGTGMSLGPKQTHIAGFSGQILELIKNAEQDPEILIAEIEAIEL